MVPLGKPIHPKTLKKVIHLSLVAVCHSPMLLPRRENLSSTLIQGQRGAIHGRDLAQGVHDHVSVENPRPKDTRSDIRPSERTRASANRTRPKEPEATNGSYERRDERSKKLPSTELYTDLGRAFDSRSQMGPCRGWVLTPSKTARGS